MKQVQVLPKLLRVHCPFWVVLKRSEKKSYGKGSVQTVFKLSDQSGLRLTTAMYYLPDGSTIHEQGIDPEFLVECSDENETKLRIQRNINQQVLEEYDFNELFRLNPIEDLQLKEARRVLLQKP